ncbi:putative RNA-directed DNA polymerase from transposon X-element [Nephila pilipes]|uniref:Putative RNA-directed DNA polymerase from transposon X-element n=1 Tax=Nephila pilipes TaxID=299642 RepID=A0A8X6QDU6_NEPPI|nr:putative RNA-directed DNA polymerase from transposon X-element [Nephila pilipes]
MEGTAITIERRDKASITIASIYKSPRNTMLHSDLQNLFSNRRNCLAIGDFNAKHTTWNPPGSNTPGKALYSYAIKHNLQINAPEKATRQTHRPNNSIIDICVSKGLYSITSESIPALSSDHNSVIFEVEVDNLTSQKINSIQITNWNSFQNHLNNLLPGNPYIRTIDDINEAIQNFNTKYRAAINTSSKTKIIDRKPYTIPPDLHKKIKLKNLIRKRWQENKDRSYKRTLNKLNREIKNELQTHNNDIWNNILKDANPEDLSLYELLNKNKRKKGRHPSFAETRRISNIQIRREGRPHSRLV